MIEIGDFNRLSVQSMKYQNQTKINKVNSDELSHDKFHGNYLNQNLPVIIQSIPENWSAMQKWIKKSEANLSLDFDYLKREIPNHKVPIADCSKQHLNCHEKFEMNFYDFLDYWESLVKDVPNDNLWYLKDWHLRKYLPSYEFYETPHYFGSDWLNEFLIKTEQDDYKFVYMGPKGTWLEASSSKCISFTFHVFPFKDTTSLRCFFIL